MDTFDLIEFEKGFELSHLTDKEIILLRVASLNLKAFNDRIKPNSDLVLRFSNNELKTKNTIDDNNGKLQVEN